MYIHRGKRICYGNACVIQWGHWTTFRPVCSWLCWLVPWGWPICANCFTTIHICIDLHTQWSIVLGAQGSDSQECYQTSNNFFHVSVIAAINKSILDCNGQRDKDWILKWDLGKRGWCFIRLNTFVCTTIVFLRPWKCLCLTYDWWGFRLSELY